MGDRRARKQPQEKEEDLNTEVEVGEEEEVLGEEEEEVLVEEEVITETEKTVRCMFPNNKGEIYSSKDVEDYCSGIEKKAYPSKRIRIETKSGNKTITI